jgi:hypothetical protein
MKQIYTTAVQLTGRQIGYSIRTTALILSTLLIVLSAGAQAPTVASLQATGTGIKWYSVSTGGTALSTSTLLVNGNHYYASQTVNGIESTTRLDVIANFVIPAAPAAGTHTPSKTQMVWNWAASTNATGYKWSATNNYATATDMATATTKTETGLTCETAYTRYVWAYDACGYSAAQTLTSTTESCWDCGDNLTISHVSSGGVAPVDKSVTYGTATGIAGEATKCWITRNLGASQQAATANDATEASAGWYWQFNRKQGYKHDGTTMTPSGWDATDDSDLLPWDIAKDPCRLELGGTWRIPTVTEWSNIDASNSWTNWTAPFDSDLKLHGAGGISSGYLMNQGVNGTFWSVNQPGNGSNGQIFHISSTASFWGNTLKRFGNSVRCIK